MRTICFKSFRELPVGVFVIYMAALVMAVAGGVMMLLDILGVIEGMLNIEMALIVGSVWISNIILFKFKDKLYK